LVVSFTDLAQALSEEFPPQGHDLVSMAEFQEPLEAMLDLAVVRDVPFTGPVVAPGGLGRHLPDLVSGLRDESRDVPFLERDPLAELLVDLGKAPGQRPDEVGQLILRFFAEVLFDLVVPVDRAALPSRRPPGAAGSAEWFGVLVLPRGLVLVVLIPIIV